jgi:SAM-dependent methyltransferase
VRARLEAYEQFKQIDPKVVENVQSAPSGAVASLDAAGLSPALADLLETFVARGSHCLQVGQAADGSLRRWLLQHDCSHIDAAASRATQLPFEDEAFDAALLIGMLAQVEEPGPAVTELRRVLRPGGVLLVTATNTSYWRHRLDRVARSHDPQPDGISPDALRQLLLESGFSLVGVEGQDGAFIRDLPLAGRLWRRRGSGPYRVAERFFPSLLGSRVGAFAIRV